MRLAIFRDIHGNRPALAIARPEGRVYFAGEHASSLRGWMQGAFEQGR